MLERERKVVELRTKDIVFLEIKMRQMEAEIENMKNDLSEKDSQIELQNQSIKQNLKDNEDLRKRYSELCSSKNTNFSWSTDDHQKLTFIVAIMNQ